MTHDSYNPCGICGAIATKIHAPNLAPIRWWDPDDGWKIGTLCTHCIREFGKAKPHPDDFAYSRTNGVCDDEDTDEDPIEALFK